MSVTAAEMLIKVGIDNDLDRGLATAESSFNSFGSKLMGIGAGLTAALTVPIVSFGEAAVESAMKMEQMKSGLAAVMGSAEGAARHFDRLVELAKAPGLTLEQAVTASTNLQAAGWSAGQAENAIKQFSNALAAIGKEGAGELDGALRQLEQMSQKTQVLAGDLKPLMERVPQIGQIIRQEFGTTSTEAIQKMGISGAEMANKILEGLEKLPRSAATTRTAIENLKDGFDRALADVGRELLPYVTKGLEMMSSALSTVHAAWVTLPAPMKDVLIAIGAIAAVVGPLVLTAGAFASAISALGLTSITAAGAMGTLTTTFSALGSAAAVAAAAFVGWNIGRWAYDNIPGVQALADALADLMLKMPGVSFDIPGTVSPAPSQLESRLRARGIPLPARTPGMTDDQYNAELLRLANNVPVNTQRPPGSTSEPRVPNLGGGNQGNAEEIFNFRGLPPEPNPVLAQLLQLYQSEHVERARQFAQHLKWAAEGIKLIDPRPLSDLVTPENKEGFAELSASMSALTTDLLNATLACPPLDQALEELVPEPLIMRVRSFRDTMEELVGISENIPRTLANLIIDWQGLEGFKDAAVNLIKDIGSAVLTTVFDQLTAPLREKMVSLIGGVLSNVLGIGGDVAVAVGGQAAGAATSAAGSASGGATSGLSGAIGNLSNTINMVSGAVSAVAGVFSAIGTMRLEGTMNQVERNTAQISINLVELIGLAHKWWQQPQFILDYLYQTFTPALASLMTTTEAMSGAIVENISNMAMSLEEIKNHILAAPLLSPEAPQLLYGAQNMVIFEESDYDRFAEKLSQRISLV